MTAARTKPAMLVAAVITIVINGSVVAGVAPARIVAGRIVAPLAPDIVRLATRVSYDAATMRVIVERGTRRIVVRPAFVEDDVPFVALAPLVRRLGGSATFDSTHTVLSIELRREETIATPVPFDPALPQVTPSIVFPSPPPIVPRAIESAVPRPRRTPIPVVPSQPRSEPSAPEALPTSLRRR